MVEFGAFVSLMSLVVVFVGIRRWRPDAAGGWWIMVGGALSFLLGRGVLAVHASASGVIAPFPSPADALFLIGYGLMVGGTTDLVRRRSAAAEDDSLVDAVIVATAVGVVVLAYVVYPYVSDPSFSGLEKLLTGGLRNGGRGVGRDHGAVGGRRREAPRELLPARRVHNRHDRH